MWASPKIPEEYSKRKALVILSGGLDSCVALALALERHEHVEAITFGYGQRHYCEVDRAYKIADFYQVHTVQNNFNASLDSALTSGINPTQHSRASKEQSIPNTFVPGRNAIMLSIAAGHAYGHGLRCIYGGWNAVDYSGYPDCRPVFLDHMEFSLQLALGSEDLEIMAPLVLLKKYEIIAWGMKLKAPLHLTWSCYSPKGDKPCGTCESCKIRAKGFKEAGLKDPALG